MTTQQPTKDQSWCEVTPPQHHHCPGYTEDEQDAETCFCACHDPEERQ